jgi:hypothetical protein
MVLSSIYRFFNWQLDYSTEDEFQQGGCQSMGSVHGSTDYLHYFPTTRNGKYRPCILDKWYNTSVDVPVELGSKLFDTVLDQAIECRVFLDSRVVIFQSIRNQEEDYYQRYHVSKLYVLKEPCPSDYLVICVFQTNTGFTLVLNGFLVEFIKTKDRGVDIIEKHICPTTLPQDLQLKVVPLQMCDNVLEHVRSTIQGYRKFMALNFRNCHVVAECIARRVTFYNMKLFFETLTFEPY